MPNPFYLNTQYVDNFWIKDPTNYSTHKLNYDNAELSLALSGLHNISFNSYAAMPQMNIGMMLNNFWSNAFKAANAEFSQMMSFMPSFGGGFQMPGVTTGIGPVAGGSTTGDTTSLTRPAVPEELSTEDKQTFKNMCTDFESIVTKYSKLTNEQLEKLGIDKEQLKLLEKNYKEATSVADLEKVISDYKTHFENLSDGNLKKLLKNTYKKAESDPNLPNLTKKAIENIDSWTTIKQQVIDATQQLNKDTIINLDTKHLSSIDEPLLIENILNKPADKDKGLQEECVRYIVNLLADINVDSPQVAKAKTDLTNALRNLYPDKNNKKTTGGQSEETLKAELVKAYKQLYVEIRIAEQIKNDEENKKFIDEEKTLPKEIKDMFYETDENNKVFKFTVNEEEIKKELKEYSGLKDCDI